MQCKERERRLTHQNIAHDNQTDSLTRYWCCSFCQLDSVDTLPSSIIVFQLQLNEHHAFQYYCGVLTVTLRHPIFVFHFCLHYFSRQNVFVTSMY